MVVFDRWYALAHRDLTVDQRKDYIYERNRIRLAGQERRRAFRVGDPEDEDGVKAVARAAEEAEKTQRGKLNAKSTKMKSSRMRRPKKKALREDVALPVSTGPQPEPEGEETTGTAETGQGAAPSRLPGGVETGDGGTGQS